MSNTYTWKIEALDVKPKVGNLTDYIVTAHWRVTGTDGSENFGQSYSTTSFNVDENKKDFAAYSSLKEADIIQWVQASLGEEQVTAIHASIDAQIESMANPPVVSKPLPW